MNNFSARASHFVIMRKALTNTVACSIGFFGVLNCRDNTFPQQLSTVSSAIASDNIVPLTSKTQSGSSIVRSIRRFDLYARVQRLEDTMITKEEANASEKRAEERMDASEKRVEERMDASEKRAEKRMDASEKRTDASEKRVEERMDASEKRTEERMDASEKNMVAKF